MYNTPFHYETERSGKKGICTNERPITSMVIFRVSPYASAKTNYRLERRMLRLYTAYYHKVMKESRGKFWEENVQAPEKNPYTTFCGGETNEGNQAEKPKKR